MSKLQHKMKLIAASPNHGKNMYVVGQKNGYDKLLKKPGGLQKAGHDQLGNDAGRVYRNVSDARHAFALEPDAKTYGVYKLKHPYHPDHVIKHPKTGENLLKTTMPIHKRV